MERDGLKKNPKKIQFVELLNELQLSFQPCLAAIDPAPGA